MKHIALGLLALGFATQSVAAISQSGVVTQYGANGDPLSGVKISVDGSKTVHSNQKGVFKVHLPMSEAGQSVSFQVQKAGWEVVNHLQTRVSLSDQAAAQFVLAPKDRADTWRRLYYQVKAENIVEQAYPAYVQQKIKNGELSLEARVQLAKERQQAMSYASVFARQLRTWVPEEMDPLYRDVAQKYLQGDIDGALALLGEEELFGAPLATETEEQYRLTKINNSQALRLRANLLSQIFRFSEAEMAYKKAALLNPDDYATWLDNANFFYQKFQLELAEMYFQKALSIARNEGNALREVDALSGLGMTKHTRKDFAAARPDYEAAVGIWRDQSAKNPKKYRIDLATNLNNLAVLYSDLQLYSEAKATYQEALTIMQDYSKQDPSYQSYVDQIQQGIDALPK